MASVINLVTPTYLYVQIWMRKLWKKWGWCQYEQLRVQPEVNCNQERKIVFWFQPSVLAQSIYISCVSSASLDEIKVAWNASNYTHKHLYENAGTLKKKLTLQQLVPQPFLHCESILNRKEPTNVCWFIMVTEKLHFSIKHSPVNSIWPRLQKDKEAKNNFCATTSSGLHSQWKDCFSLAKGLHSLASYSFTKRWFLISSPLNVLQKAT